MAVNLKAVRIRNFRDALWIGALALSAFLAFGPLDLPAQGTGRVVRGVVRTDGGRPVVDALVTLDDTRRVRTNERGQFSFTRVVGSPHSLRVISIGFRPDERDIEVPATGLQLTIELERLATLDTVSIRATRLGVYGAVASREDLRPLDLASVEVMREPQARSVTAADGKFSYPAVRPGAHLVRVQRDGFRSRLLSVTVPVDSGVELVLFLDSASSKRDRYIESQLHQMDSRVHWSGSGAALVPGSELQGNGRQRLYDAIQTSPSFFKKGMIVGNPCVFVDGRPRPGLHVNDINPDDVAAVELYGSRGDYTGILESQWPGCGSGGAMTPQPSGPRSTRAPRRQFAMDNSVRVVVIWMKR